MSTSSTTGEESILATKEEVMATWAVMVGGQPADCPRWGRSALIRLVDELRVSPSQVRSREPNEREELRTISGIRPHEDGPVRGRTSGERARRSERTS